MRRFTIRDVLWFTLVVGLSLGGWLILSQSARVCAEERVQTSGDSTPDATRLAWEPEHGSVAHTRFEEEKLYHVAFLPNAQQLVGVTDRGTLIVFHRRDLSRLHSFHPGAPYCYPGIAPDGQRIAVGTDAHAVGVYSLVERRTLFNLAAHTDSILRISWSPDGRWIASGGSDGTVRLWDAERRRLVQSIEPDGKTIFALAFSPNSKTLAIRTQGETVLLWNIEENVEALRLSNQGNNCSTIAFSPDGTQWATMRNAQTVVVRHELSDREISQFSAPWANVAWSPDGRLFAVPDRGSVNIVHPATGILVQRFRCHSDWVESLSFAPDSRSLATISGHGRLALWDVSSLDQLKRATAVPLAETASVNHRYSDVVRVFESEGDQMKFGALCEYGYRKRVNGAPDGYWVYAAPRWYVFTHSRIGLPSPPEQLPAPFVQAHQRLIWIAFPHAVCRQNGVEHASRMPNGIAQIQQASLTYAHGFRFQDDRRRNTVTAVLEVSLDENTTTEQALELIQKDGWGMSSAEILTEKEARSAGLLK